MDGDVATAVKLCHHCGTPVKGTRVTRMIGGRQVFFHVSCRDHWADTPEGEIVTAIDAGEWCEYHHRREPWDPEKHYKFCAECGHVFETEEELVSTHRGGHLCGHSAEEIYFCPHCAHDF